MQSLLPRLFPRLCLSNTLSLKTTPLCAISLRRAMATCSLKDMKCEACSGGVKPLSSDEITEHMRAVPLWEAGGDGKSITRRFTARNFKAAMDFIVKAGEIAEEEKHHPDLHITNYRDVQLVLSTHAVDALTINDFILAAKIDALPVDYSPKWMRERGLGQ